MSSNILDPQVRPALAAGVRLQARAGNSESALLYPEGILVLNETADAIVRCCDGQSTVSQIVEQLGTEYGMDRRVIETDVCDCLSELLQRNLVVLQT